MRFATLGLALTASLYLAPSLAAQRGPAIVGEHQYETFETPHPYPSSGSESALLSWSDEVYFPDATYIAVHFSRFDLAPGDYLVVRSPDGKQSRTYRGYGRHDLGRTPEGFFATHVKGDTAILELYTQGTSEAYGYKVDYFGRGYSDLEIETYWALGLGEKMNLVPPRDRGESLCTADDTEEAKCYQISEPEAYDKSRAVARLLLNGSAHCTGWLVGSEGHLMTNEHCVTSQSQMNNIDFEFMAEGATCATNCGSALACSGVIEATGGTFVTDDAPLDYALLLPDTSTGTGTDLAATYGFMRLRDTGTVLNERIYLVEHPAGWGKRFAMLSTYPEDVGLGGFAYATSINEVACSGGPGDIGYWADTQGGSSGSPVLGYSDHRVIGLHHCRGSAFCTTGNAGTDDRNRAVPIEAVITSLGALLPNGAVCDPPGDPSATTAVANGANQIDVSWTAPPGGTTGYNVYRALGSCPLVGGTLISADQPTTSFSDTTVSGGSTYAYAVKSFLTATNCESGFSACSEATATGLCTLPPTFAGVTTVASAAASNCGIDVSWNAATENCGTAVSYNVYRSTTSGFTPGAGNLVASCVSGSSYVDFDVISGTPYFYVVRAEDNSNNGAGPCGGGNEESNTTEGSAAPFGPDLEAFFDDMESGSADWTTTGTSGTPWAQVSTMAHSGTTSWFTADEPSAKDQRVEQIADVAIPVGGATLSFWHRYNTENNWDGGVLEFSTDGGTTWFDILDGDGAAISPNSGRFLQGAYPDSLNTSATNPLSGRPAWNGDNSLFEQVQVDLADFAGTNVRFRWRLGCDGSISVQGWWVDDVRIATRTMCIAADFIFANGFESGDTSSWSVVVN